MNRLLDTLADLLEGLRNEAEIEHEHAPELSLEGMITWQAANIVEGWHAALVRIANGEADAAEIARTAVMLLQKMNEDEEPLSEMDKLRKFLKPRIV